AGRRGPSRPGYDHQNNHGSPASRAERERTALRPSNLIRIMPAQGGVQMSTSTSASASTAKGLRRPDLWRWRVVDIVVASVIAVACAVIFLLWNVGYEAPSTLLKPLLPGVQGLLAGPWLLAGV